MPKTLRNRNSTSWLLFGFLIATMPVSGDALGSDDNSWWQTDWKQRMAVVVPAGSSQELRIPFPAGAQPAEIRCVIAGEKQPVVHWSQNLEFSPRKFVAKSRDAHYGFPRLVRAANGDYLIFYRVGLSHAYDQSSIAMRRSKSKGKTWSDERTLFQDKTNFSAHNPVALVTESGRVLLWISHFQFQPKPHKRHAGFWTYSDDNGTTWAKFTRFDSDTTRSSYYITDAVRTADGLLANAATFPASGIGNCYAVNWFSKDDGKTWNVLSRLTQPAENLGDEVGYLETSPGDILCFLRDRRREDLYRLRSTDGGKTWSKRERLAKQLGCTLQRPFLTRIDQQTVLLSGRDQKRRQIVVYVSRDNGKNFAERHVLETYQKDGAYTTALLTDQNSVLFSWYSDHGSEPLKPDIKQTSIRVHAKPKWLWIHLPKELPADQKLFVYFGNSKATSAENRVAANVYSKVWTDLKVGSQPFSVELKP